MCLQAGFGVRDVTAIREDELVPPGSSSHGGLWQEEAQEQSQETCVQGQISKRGRRATTAPPAHTHALHERRRAKIKRLKQVRCF